MSVGKIHFLHPIKVQDLFYLSCEGFDKADLCFLQVNVNAKRGTHEILSTNTFASEMTGEQIKGECMNFH